MTTVYLIYLSIAGAISAWCLLLRLMIGASPIFLMRTRFYEVPPLRLLFHAAHLGIWLGFATATLIGVRYGWTYLESSNLEHVEVAIWAAIIAAVCWISGRIVCRWFISIPDNAAPAVSVRGVETVEGADLSRLATLGKEQFPEMLAYGCTGGLTARRVLAAVGSLAVVYVIAAATEWGRENGLYGAGIDLLRSARGMAPEVPPPWTFVAGVSSSLGLSLLLFGNSSYTLMRFPHTLIIASVFCVTSWQSAGMLGANDDQLGCLFGVIACAFVVRWMVDLNRASGFTRVRGVTVPISQRIAERVPGLAKIKHRDSCRLVMLDEQEIRERIARGCRNVEEASPLVTRNFSRFLSLVRIRYEHFAAAVMRFLTVRRFITRNSGGGTTRTLQQPSVPMWNESLFPLRPPSGYRNWLDPLGLGWDWDIVEWCSSCGGSGRVRCNCGNGRVQRTETYTEYSGGQTVTRTRTVEETCGTCGGSGYVTCSTCSGLGKVVFHQTLNTQWQRLLPSSTSPHVHVPEFMEEAEERNYFQLSLMENREYLDAVPTNDGIDSEIESELSNSARELAAELPEFVRLVEQLHGGRMYRAEFQVNGFWVMQIVFRFLPGKVGWFFGRRPEFHFPSLPLSWGYVGTVMFVLPFTILSASWVVAIVVERLQSMLPPL